MDLKRRKPLDEAGDTAMDLIEREAEGVQVEAGAERRATKKTPVRSDLGGLPVTEKHVEAHERKS